ncbi:MAG TPA: amidohydrolase [Cyclobacteriaceae bacterium]
MERISNKSVNKTSFIIKQIFFIALIFVNGSVLGQNSDRQKIMRTRVDAIEKKVIQWRQDIHQHPELGNHEFRTAALIADHLRSLGMEVRTNVAVTGVVAVLKGDKPGPVVALRADMDALPVIENNSLPFASTTRAIYNDQETGVMHACGHDAHVAILMGVAEVLSGTKKYMKGSVKFIFQPAEESPPKGERGGAELMIEEGALENPKVDALFALHVNAQLEVGKITYRPGGFFAAAADFKITVKGTGSHGAEPWSGVDPIVTSAQIINNLQTILSRSINVTENPAVVSIGSIHGGNRFNIIPGQVEMIGTVRTLSNADEDLVYKRIRTIAEKTAESAGAVAEVQLPFTARHPVMINDVNLTSAMLPSLQRTVGSQNVIAVPASTSAEDFSRFAQRVPSFYFYIGGLPEGKNKTQSAPHHTSGFFIDERGFKTGVNALCNLVVDYLERSTH